MEGAQLDALLCPGLGLPAFPHGTSVLLNQACSYTFGARAAGGQGGGARTHVAPLTPPPVSAAPVAVPNRLHPSVCAHRVQCGTTSTFRRA
eukprot:6780793-Prymnesium_polylepis.1